MAKRSGELSGEGRERAAGSKTWIHLAVLALYGLLAVGLSWPVVQSLSTRVPGSGTWAFDEYTFLWNSWWFRYALLNLGQDPLQSTYTFYPVGIGLVLYTYNLFNAALSVPLQPFLSLAAISNLTFLLATVLSGYGTFLLVLYLARDLGEGSQTAKKSTVPRSAALAAYLAAVLAGLAYAFGSYRMVYAALGHYDMWSTGCIPFYALYLVRTIREARLRHALMAGVFLVLALLAEMIFGVFLAILTAILLASAAGRGREQIAGGWGALAKRLTVIALVAVVLYAPLLVPILRDLRAGYELVGWGGAEKLSVDLLGFVTPTALHPLGGDWVTQLRQVLEGTARFRDVNTVFLGWASLALAILGALIYRRRLTAWIASALTFAILCLGPVLQVGGRSLFDLDGLQISVPLPYILLHYIPIVSANRVPNRFSVVLMLALAVLAGFGAFWLLRKAASSKQQAARILLPALLFLLPAFCILFEHAAVPLPTTDARIPAAYERIASEPGDFAILQLPLGWRNSFGILGSESTQTQYYQSYHHKRLLSGNISRNPPFKFDYFRRIPVLHSLATIQAYGDVPAERRLADRATADEMVSFYDIRYIAVAPGIPGRPPYVDTRDAAVAYVEETLPVEKVYDEGGWLLYRVRQQALPATLTVDVGSTAPLELMALGEGWAGAERIGEVSARWAEAQGARLLLPAAEGTGYRLAIRAMPFDFPGAPAQQVTLRVNEHRLAPLTLSSGWQSCAWDVPSDLLHGSLNDLRLEFSRLDAPAEVLPGDGAIGRTGVQAPAAIEVNSGGLAGFAFIGVGDGVDGSLHRPGYNVAVIHPRTGRILERQGFDTTPGGSEAEAERLTSFLAGLPDGRIVAVAIQGDGAARLTDAAVVALQSIGAQGDPRMGTGWSHAVIGVKGAAPGTALEVLGAENSWLRVAPDRRTLAIAVDGLTWEPLAP